MAMDLNKRIGLEIRYMRLRHDITQERLAELLDVPPTQISHWETGRRAVSINKLYKIAQILDCEPVDLMPSVTVMERETNGN